MHPRVGHPGWRNRRGGCSGRSQCGQHRRPVEIPEELRAAALQRAMVFDSQGTQRAETAKDRVHYRIVAAGGLPPRTGPRSAPGAVSSTSYVPIRRPDDLPRSAASGSAFGPSRLGSDASGHPCLEEVGTVYEYDRPMSGQADALFEAPCARPWSAIPAGNKFPRLLKGPCNRNSAAGTWVVQKLAPSQKSPPSSHST